jgi:hypothetical protein
LSWKNEFHHWLHDLQPAINVYLFSNDDIRGESREEFLRQVRIYIIIYNIYQKKISFIFSGTKTVVFY